jgi:hypothetical protein
MASSVGPAFAGASGAAWAEIAYRASNPAQVEIIIRIMLSASNVLPSIIPNPSRRRTKIYQKLAVLVTFCSAIREEVCWPPKCSAKGRCG